MFIKSIKRDETKIYTVIYRGKGILRREKKRKTFLINENSRNWFWLDTGESVGKNLSRVLSGMKSREIEFLEI